MSAALVAWIVWRDRFPLTPIELGTVHAPDKRAAVSLAAEAFPGERIQVQSAASHAEARRVTLGPGRILPRTPAPRDPDTYRQFAARKRSQAQRARIAEAQRLEREATAMPLDFSGRRGTPSSATAQRNPTAAPVTARNDAPQSTPSRRDTR